MAKNYESIVKPLKKIAEKLTAYAENQKNVVHDLKVQKETIDVSISESQQEGKMATFTAGKIGALLGADGFEDMSDETPQPDSNDAESDSAD